MELLVQDLTVAGTISSEFAVTAEAVEGHGAFFSGCRGALAPGAGKRGHGRSKQDYNSERKSVMPISKEHFPFNVQDTRTEMDGGLEAMDGGER